jgi:hypothetical protein
MRAAVRREVLPSSANTPYTPAVDGGEESAFCAHPPAWGVETPGGALVGCTLPSLEERPADGRAASPASRPQLAGTSAGSAPPGDGTVPGRLDPRPEERIAERAEAPHAPLMEPEPQWSDTTVIIDLLLDVQTGVDRLLGYFKGDDDEEEAEEDS